jgi:hypothetical protein
VIDLVLDKRFVLEQATHALGALTEIAREGRAAQSTAQLAEPERPQGVAKVRRALLEAIEEESRVSLLEEEESRAYIPRNRVLSILQTTIEEELRRSHPDLLRPVKAASEEEPLVTEVVEDPDQFTHRDPRWLETIAKAVAARFLRPPHDFVEDLPPPQFKLADKARIILVGDWGTGGLAAKEVGKLVREELEGAGDVETHLIHLGDVYYMGETEEAKRNLLDLWPIKPAEARRWHSWALNGNHDMYSGGYGYFDTILGDDRFAGQRRADGRAQSFFRLHNAHWQLLGLDSAWDNHLLRYRGLHGFLKDPQGKWVYDSVKAAGGRRTILLTHHQFLSTHEHHLRGDFPAKLRRTFEAGGVEAWFWGHEHRCMTFYPRPQVRYAACVGNGAMPERARGGIPDSAKEWEYDLGPRWRWCGFAVLDLEGARIKVRYIDQRDITHHEDTLPENP